MGHDALMSLDQSNGQEEAQADATAAAPRARLVSVTVQLHVVADDGEVLHPLQVAPIEVVAGNWSSFRVEDQISDVQRQLDERSPKGVIHA